MSEQFFTIKKAVSCLLKSAENNLTRDELSMLSGATGMAAEMAGDASRIASGLAFLISNDQNAPGPLAAGNFDDETPMLLHNLAAQLDAITALITLGQEASHRLNQMEKSETLIEEPRHDRINLQ